MRTMTSNEMMQANGGKYRYRCIYCGKKFRSSFGKTLHTMLTRHNSFAYVK